MSGGTRGPDHAAARQQLARAQNAGAAAQEITRATQEQAARLQAWMARASKDDVEALLALAPLVGGMREHARWSVSAAGHAVAVGKPVHLVVSVTGKGVDAELVTGKLRIVQD